MRNLNKDICKIDKKGVNYTTPCRHDFKNPTVEELKQNNQTKQFQLCRVRFTL